MGTLNTLVTLIRGDALEWENLRIANLVFGHNQTALLMLMAVVGASILVLAARFAMQRRPGRDRIALPAILASTGGSRFALIRHGAFLFFLAGLPFFVLAVAGPYTAVAQQNVSYPGRRIALMIDASSSMMAPFAGTQLVSADATGKGLFFTTVAAANAFIKQRMNGKYSDLIALIEFGDEAYVITPFTSDYNNILLSTSLIGDWSEFMRFPDQGTTIGTAIRESIDLFKAFEFLNASGNLMVIFSDGQDTQITTKGVSINEILKGAIEAKIPVYFIRTSQNKELGDLVPDAIWRPAVELTGGRFFAAANENDILQAIKDIDMRAAGKIEIKQYATQQQKFAPFAGIAAAFWSIGLVLKLTIPYFSKFP